MELVELNRHMNTLINYKNIFHVLHFCQLGCIHSQVPSREVDKSEGKFWSLWNKDTKEFFLQFAFKKEREGRGGPGGGGPNVIPPHPATLLPHPTPAPVPPSNLPPPPLPPTGGPASLGMMPRPPPPVGMVPPPMNPVPPPPPM